MQDGIATQTIFLAVVCMFHPLEVDRRLDHFPRGGRRSNINDGKLRNTSASVNTGKGLILAILVFFILL